MMRLQVRIRPATTDDRDFIRSLASRLTAVSELAWRDRERISQFNERGVCEAAAAITAVAHGAIEVVLIAEASDARPLGVIHLKDDTSVLTGEAQGYVSLLAVVAEAEGRGVARALLAAGERWARERGYRHLALDVFASNHHARGVYTHIGFAEETLKMVKPLT